MMLENPEAKYIITPGMNDETFVRGKVPMTKEEIRILSVAKLQLTEDAIVYDVGAGTGSVSAECARLCTSGCVYAIERNPEGIAADPGKREAAEAFEPDSGRGAGSGCNGWIFRYRRMPSSAEAPETWEKS